MKIDLKEEFRNKVLEAMKKKEKKEKKKSEEKKRVKSS